MKQDKNNHLPKKNHQLSNPIMRSMNEFFNQKPVQRLLDSIDDFFEQPFPIPTIPVEMYETDQDLIITADLPGIKKEQISLEYSSSSITIAVQHTEDIEEKNETNPYFFKKQTMNYSSRLITLPYPVNERLIKASYNNGQLRIRVPKQPRRKIEISEEN
ncbi:Hsp20/alpha crystallin family protein [Litchfieldia alkalitelluris]|uniref:Hsp20/alpha crystallin family protein n=1 Tax=Litchfieldia alkalitelluris TaxID=304268 RepID=UPI000996145F|nr:Hsp20/alpha crystallin family protein [Litchfieldia alkalitelluris]